MADPLIVQNVYQAPENLVTLLTSIASHLTTLETHGELLMSKFDDLNAKLDTINTETNEIAADIDRLLANGLTGLTKDEADQIEARLAAHSTALQAVAAKS